MDWNDENTETLKRLYADGYSMSQIARQLGQGCTRNAALGKAHRLGLTGGRQNGKSVRIATAGTAATRDKVVAIAAAKKAKPIPKPEAVDEPAPALDAEGKPITLRTSGDKQCRWYVGDNTGPDGQVCGNETADRRKPFCAHHQARLRNATAMQQLKRSLNAVPTVKARALKHA